MSNNYEQHITWEAYRRALDTFALRAPSQQTELDLRQADDIKAPGSALPGPQDCAQ
jgi:hypothetical protein